MPKCRVLIVSGEASGDHHAAQLITEVRKISPDVHFFGMGGEKMREAGADIVIDSKSMAVVGAIEILAHFAPIYRAWKKLRYIIKHTPPDLVVLLDYPEFNLQIAKAAKKAGVKVLYYISPQVWAWKQKRVKTIKQRVNKMLVIFPFEAEFYQRAGVPVEFVGHPLTDKVKPTKDKSQMLKSLNIDADKRVVGLLPGSRKGEIKRLLPVMLASAEALKKTHDDLEFLIPLASSLSMEDLAPYLATTSLNIHIIKDDFYNAMQLCEAAIVTSGTATLETALMVVPMAIIYKTSWSTYHMVKWVIKIPYIGLCNIVAGKHIVKEFIQHEANAKNISGEIEKILDDELYRQRIIAELRTVKEKLGISGGSERAARALLDML